MSTRSRSPTSEERWQAAWRELGLAPPAALAELLARYAEPHRVYHTRRHLEECFLELDRAAPLARHPGEVAIALWFHDAIYDPRSSDNERRSAEWAEHVAVAAGAGAKVAARIRELVLATRHDAPAARGDAELLVDIDLSILGAAEERFAEYESQIAREYAWVPAEIFRRERARILRAFLAREALYRTSFFRDRLESRARANLTRSIVALGA